MFDLKYLDKNVNEVLDMVQTVRNMGLVQGQDFDFAFFQEKYDGFSNEPFQKKHVVFTFYNEKWATLFGLKWS